MLAISVMLGYAFIGVCVVSGAAGWFGLYTDQQARPASVIVGLLTVVSGSVFALTALLTGSDVDPAVRSILALRSSHDDDKDKD